MNVENGLCGSILPAVKQLVILGLIAMAIKITAAQATQICRQIFHFYSLRVLRREADRV